MGLSQRWQFQALVTDYRCHIRYRCDIRRVGQNRIYTPYVTVCMVISLPMIPYIHRIYL